MPKKEPRERIQLEAPSDLVAEWKAEAKQSRITFSEFIRRACIRYAAAKKKKREESAKDKAG